MTVPTLLWVQEPYEMGAAVRKTSELKPKGFSSFYGVPKATGISERTLSCLLYSSPRCPVLGMLTGRKRMPG